MDKKKKKLSIIVAVVAATAIFSLAMKSCMKNAETTFETHFSKKSFNFKNQKFSVDSSYVAVVHIEGVIEKGNRNYNQEWLLQTIEDLADDPKNRGILLFVNSPGGTVYEADEAYLALMDYKENTNRPVYAYFSSLAASGGYYIASAADYIYSNRNSLVGSIGVIFGQSVDATELMSKIGIKMRTFTAGRNKTMGSYDQPLTEEQIQIFQSIADDAYEQFTQIVAESRNLPIERVQEIADGRVYTARQAKDVQLVDEICKLQTAQDSIRNDLEEDVEFIDYNYEYKESIYDFLNFARTLTNPPQSRLQYMMQ